MIVISRKLKHGIIYLLFTLLLSSVPFLYIAVNKLWLLQSNILYTLKPFEYFIQILAGWDSKQLGIGSANAFANTIPLVWSIFIQNVIGVNRELSQTFLLWVFFVGGSIGFLYFLRHHLSNRLRPLSFFIGLFSFLFNGYILTYLVGTPNFVFVYLMLPWQLYFFEKYIGQNGIKRSLRPLIILAIINQLTLWVNLVFFFVTFFILCLVGVLNIIQKKIGVLGVLKTQFITWSITLFLCSFWLVPLLYGGMIDTASTASVLESEKFYNSDSGPINVLRNLGYWGFFASNNGEYYYRFSEYYRSILLIIATLVPLAAIALVVFFRKILFQNSHNSIILFFWTITIFILFPIIGGVHSLWPTANPFRWVLDNVPFFSIFRNTHKWMMLIVFAESILLAIIVEKMIQWRNVFGKLAIFLLVIFLVIGAWPFITNDVIQPERYISKIPVDWIDMASFVNRDKNDINRIFLLPDQYGEVYNWERKRVQIPGSIANALLSVPSVSNTCRGCLPAYSEELIHFLYSRLGSPNLDTLFGQIGISHILQRDDYAYQYYKNIQSPGEIEEILKRYPSISPKISIGNLKLFSLDNNLLNPIIYSPNNISISDNIEEHTRHLQLSSGKESGFFLSETKSNIVPGSTKNIINDIGNYSRTIFRPDSTKMHGYTPTDTFTIPNSYSSYTIEPLSNRYLYNVSISKLDGKLHFKASPDYGTVLLDGEKIFTEPAAPNSNIINPIASKSLILRLGTDTPPLFSENYFDTEIFEYNRTMTGKSENVQVYQYVQRDTTTTDTKKTWNKTVGNCRKTKENASINMAVQKGIFPEDPVEYIRLTAEEDSACTFVQLENPIDRNALYHISVKYRNIMGEKPELCIWDGRECVIREILDSVVVNSWNTTDIFFTPKDLSTQLLVYIYSHQGNYEKTINEYADIEIEPLFGRWEKIGDMFISESPRRSVIRKLKKGAHTLSAINIPLTKNLISNGSFEIGLWGKKAGNCGSQNTNSVTKIDLVKDGSDGNLSLELFGENGNACIASNPLQTVNENESYILSFDYKILDESTSQICVWNGKACIFKKTYDKIDSGWEHVDEIFQTDRNSKSLSIYLYSPSKEKPNQVRYDNIILKRLGDSILSSLKISPTQKQNIEKLETVVEKISQIHYKLHFRKKPTNTSVLIFQETYHPSWEIWCDQNTKKIRFLDRIIGTNCRIDSDSHFVVNGFANGWILTPSALENTHTANDGSFTLDINYTSQRWFYLGLLISGTTLAGCIGYLAYDFARRRRNRRRKDSFPAIPATNMIDYPRTEPVAKDAPKPAVPTSLHTPQVVIKRPPRRKV